MDGYGKTLYWFSEENLMMEVPFFQRPYVWDADNWQSLIESIEKADDKKMPFLGSFILKGKEDNEKVYWVIDGQQRITTLSIFIRAFLDQKKYKVINQVINNLEGMIYNIELIDGDNALYTPRLIPSNADADPFEKVMTTDKENITFEKGKTSIEDCYIFFSEYINNLSQDQFGVLKNKIITNAKYVIAIVLGAKDDEQEIFDTVNSLGKKLTNSDIIKNYLYQKMKANAGDNKKSVEEVLKIYDKYWKKIFIDDDFRAFWDKKISLGRITTTNLDAFLKDFGTIKKIYIPSESGGIEGLSKEYKKYIDGLDCDGVKKFAIEISEYASKYYTMWKNYEDCNDFKLSDRLNTTLLLLDRLETSTFNSYILNICKNADQTLDEKLFGLQKFILRRFLWRATTKNYNKCCIEALDSTDPNKYFKEYNLNTDGIDWNEYPTQIKNLRNNQGTLLLFLIEMIRRFKNGEGNYADTLLYNKTLEHIMPQKWKEKWFNVESFKIDSEKGGYVEVSDEEKEQNRKAKICSLGNMSLLTAKLNTSISNDEFKVKIDGKQNKKGIRTFVGNLSVTNEIVASYDANPKWDERDIIEREASLMNEINDYYGFVSNIKIDFEEKMDETRCKYNLQYFSDGYFDNNKIGLIARETFTYLLENKMLFDNEIELLKNKEYSNTTFGISMPLLETDESKLRDKKNMLHYYEKPIELEEKIYLNRDWCNKFREKTIIWLKERINRNIN